MDDLPPDPGRARASEAVNRGVDITDMAHTMQGSRVHDGGMGEAALSIFVRVNVEVRQN